MKTSIKSFLEQELSHAIDELARCSRLNNDTVRNLLTQLEQQPLPFEEFNIRLKTLIFPIAPEITDALAQLRSYLTATAGALHRVKERCSDTQELSALDLKAMASENVKNVTPKPILSDLKPEESTAEDNDLEARLLNIFLPPPESVSTERNAGAETNFLNKVTFRGTLKELLDNYHQVIDDTQKLHFAQKIREHIKSAKTSIIDFSNLDLTDVDLSGLDLQGSDFTGAIIEHTNFSDANLRSATFAAGDRYHRHKISANFSGADCRGVDCSYCDLRLATFNTLTRVEDLVLREAHVSRTVLEFFLPHARWWSSSRANRPEVSLRKVSFEDENLANLDLSGLYLEGAYFKGADVSRTKFGDADIHGAYLGQAKNLSIEQLARCVNFKTAHLPSWSEKKRQSHEVYASQRSIDSIFKRVHKAAAETPSTAPPAPVSQIRNIS